MDDSLDQELIISQKQEYNDKKELLNNAMEWNDREKEIITARRLSEIPITLEELSKNLKLVEKELDRLKRKRLKIMKSMINASRTKICYLD